MEDVQAWPLLRRLGRCSAGNSTVASSENLDKRWEAEEHGVRPGLRSAVGSPGKA